MLRNLGEFFGHIVQGIKTPVDPPPAEPVQGPGPHQPPPPAAVRQIVEEREIQTPEGKVILRRTVIDEVRTEPVRPQNDAPKP